MLQLISEFSFMLEGFLKQACFQGMSHYSINSSWVEIDGWRAKWVKNGRKWPPFPSVKESLNKRLLKRLLQNDVLAQLLSDLTTHLSQAGSLVFCRIHPKSHQATELDASW